MFNRYRESSWSNKHGYTSRPLLFRPIAEIISMKFLTTTLFACLCQSTLAAEATTLTFDAYSPGTILTNEYAAQGVNFTGDALVYTQPPYYVSPFNGLAALSSVFSALFDWDVTHVEATFLDSEGGSNVGSLSAYDVKGTLLGSVTATTPGSGVNYLGVLLQLDYPDIRRVDFLAPDDGAVVDNLTFTPSSATTIPEPGSLTLVVLGLAALGFVRKPGNGKRSQSPFPMNARKEMA
jgi:hypothetical protein